MKRGTRHFGLRAIVWLTRAGCVAGLWWNSRDSMHVLLLPGPGGQINALRVWFGKVAWISSRQGIGESRAWTVTHVSSSGAMEDDRSTLWGLHSKMPTDAPRGSRLMNLLSYQYLYLPADAVTLGGFTVTTAEGMQIEPQRDTVLIGSPLWFWTAVPLLFCGLNVRRAIVLIRRKRAGCCLICGYDLRASPDRCPECGTRLEN
jgi:hypothetical protein